MQQVSVRCFIDYNTAFDWVNHTKIIECLKELQHLMNTVDKQRKEYGMNVNIEESKSDSFN